MSTSPRTARPRPTGALTAGLVAAFALSLTGCPKPDPDPPPPETGDRAASRAALAAAAGECVLSEARVFDEEMASLDAAVNAWSANPDAATLSAARAAYTEAMNVWQRLEVMQVGPLARRPAPGFGDLRDHVYSWPLVSRCAVEEQVVSQSYAAPNFGTQVLTRRGLDALEYLLFHESETTACPPSSSIVKDGTWAALTPVERAERKRDYAVAVTADLRTRSTAIVSAWAPEGGNFLETMKTAGPGNAVFPTTQMALNALSDALFYVEAEVKDMKLAKPLGLRECELDTCPELLESQHARKSAAWIRANIEGAEKLLLGCGENDSGLGFDDLLDAYGATELAERLRAQPAQIHAALDALGSDDFAPALAGDKAKARAVYDALKGLTDILKVEMITVLDLELPQTIEGDND